MKLYYMPGACSLAVHIALREAGLAFGLVEVNYRTRRTETGHDFHAINPKGTVPALSVDGGDVLTEVAVILQVVAAAKGGAGLLPADGMARLRALEWLSFVGTEIHKSFSPLFRPTTPKAFLKPGRDHLVRRLTVIEQHLSAHRYSLGRDFSLADAYLFTVCRWLTDQDLAIADWPALQRHSDDIQARPAVGAALAYEKLTGHAGVSDQLADCGRPRQVGHDRFMQNHRGRQG